MVLALTPNSASPPSASSRCSPKHMFGDTQGGALGDYLEVWH